MHVEWSGVHRSVKHVLGVHGLTFVLWTGVKVPSGFSRSNSKKGSDLPSRSYEVKIYYCRWWAMNLLLCLLSCPGHLPRTSSQEAVGPEIPPLHESVKNHHANSGWNYTPYYVCLCLFANAHSIYTYSDSTVSLGAVFSFQLLCVRSSTHNLNRTEIK